MTSGQTRAAPREAAVEVKRFVSPRGTRVELEDLGDVLRVRLRRPDEPLRAEPFAVTVDAARDRAFAERAFAAICCALEYTEGLL